MFTFEGAADTAQQMVRYMYVDESWDDRKFCLTVISVRHSDWHTCFRRIQEHRKMLQKDHGVFMRKEIHARTWPPVEVASAKN